MSGHLPESGTFWVWPVGETTTCRIEVEASSRAGLVQFLYGYVARERPDWIGRDVWVAAENDNEATCWPGLRR